MANEYVDSRYKDRNFDVICKLDHGTVHLLDV